MENIYHFTLTEVVCFGMVLLRMTAFIVAWPVFGTNLVSTPIKILFALALTFILYPVVGYKQLNPEALVEIVAVREIFIGLSLGFLSRLFFFAVGIAGQLISITIGLSSAQLFNPAVNENSTSIEQFHLILASLFFLSINGHQMLLSALAKSFEFVPLSAQFINIKAFGQLDVLIQEIFLIGVRLSAPILISILFLNLAMAVIGRAVPQMNVLVTSMPVNILVGFVVLFVTVPLLLGQMDDLVSITFARLFQVMKAF